MKLFLLSIAVVFACKKESSTDVKGLAANANATNIAVIFTGSDEPHRRENLERMRKALGSPDLNFKVISYHNASRELILKVTKQAAALVKEDGTLLWYLNTHGKNRYVTAQKVPFRFSEILSALTEARSTPLRRFVALVDTCESGEVISDFSNFASRSLSVSKVDFDGELQDDFEINELPDELDSQTTESHDVLEAFAFYENQGLSLQNGGRKPYREAIVLTSSGENQTSTRVAFSPAFLATIAKLKQQKSSRVVDLLSGVKRVVESRYAQTPLYRAYPDNSILLEELFERRESENEIPAQSLPATEQDQQYCKNAGGEWNTNRRFPCTCGYKSVRQEMLSSPGLPQACKNAISQKVNSGNENTGPAGLNVPLDVAKKSCENAGGRWIEGRKYPCLCGFRSVPNEKILDLELPIKCREAIGEVRGQIESGVAPSESISSEGSENPSRLSEQQLCERAGGKWDASAEFSCSCGTRYVRREKLQSKGLPKACQEAVAEAAQSATPQTVAGRESSSIPSSIQLPDRQRLSIVCAMPNYFPTGSEDVYPSCESARSYLYDRAQQIAIDRICPSGRGAASTPKGLQGAYVHREDGRLGIYVKDVTVTRCD